MAETVLNPQEPKIEQTLSPVPPKSPLVKILGIVSCLVMMALIVYALILQNQNSATLFRSTDLALTSINHATINYRTYVGKYKQTKIELDETTRKLEAVNRQLDAVSAELATTKGMLAQTQGLLVEAQQENASLKSELQGIDNLRAKENVQNIGELQAKIKSLKQTNSAFSTQLTDLKTQLRAFEAQFSTMAEGKSLIILFQNKIQLVRSRMNYLGHQAFLAKIEAQKEKDRLAALNGNDGYVVRQGKPQNPNGGGKSFAIDVKLVQ